MAFYDFELDDLIDFRDNATDGIFKIRKYLQQIKLDRGLCDGFKYIYNEVFAINGTAQVMELESISSILSAMEDCCRPLYLRRLEITGEIIEAFEESCDRLEEVLDVLDEDHYSIDELHEHLNASEVSDVVLYLNGFTRQQVIPEGAESQGAKLEQGDIDTLLDDLTHTNGGA